MPLGTSSTEHGDGRHSPFGVPHSNPKSVYQRAEGAMLRMGGYNGSYSSGDPEAVTVAESEQKRPD